MDREEIKNRTPDQKKAVRIYTIELLVFSAIFLTLAILELVGIIGNNTDFRLVFTFITLGGAALLIGDLIWALASPKRRARVCLLDKFIVLPAPIAIVTLDIITLIKGVEAVADLHRLMVGIVFSYIAAVYAFQAVYHYFYPLRELMEAAEEDEEEEETEEKKDEGEDSQQ